VFELILNRNDLKDLEEMLGGVLKSPHSHGSDRIGRPYASDVHGMNGPS
jgi:hypothetical protein